VWLPISRSYYLEWAEKKLTVEVLLQSLKGEEIGERSEWKSGCVSQKLMLRILAAVERGQTKLGLSHLK
jgi:hypothetical protein